MTFLRHLAPVGLMAAALPAGAQDAAAVAGDYLAQGMNVNGSRYEGRVEIREAESSTVTITWMIAGVQPYFGVGTIAGQVLVADYGDPDPAIYVIREDGTLHGTWNDGFALEKLTPER